MLVSLALGSASTASAQTERLHPFSDLGDGIGASFGGETWPWLLGAAGTTLFLVVTGTDDWIQQHLQHTNPLGRTFPRALLVAGNFSTLVAAGGLYLSGVAADDDSLANGGAGALQAVMLNFVVTTLLKIVSGRAGPYRDGLPGPAGPSWLARAELADSFALEPLRFGGGVFWPSGHTSTHFALASALVAFYPHSDWLPWLVYPIAALMGLAMIDGDYHWASDVLAGALIGHGVGWAIGSQFREAQRERQAQSSMLGEPPAPPPLLLQVAIPF